jgi:hypothetical protein
MNGSRGRKADQREERGKVRVDGTYVEECPSTSASAVEERIAIPLHGPSAAKKNLAIPAGPRHNSELLKNTVVSVPYRQGSRHG